MHYFLLMFILFCLYLLLMINIEIIKWSKLFFENLHLNRLSEKPIYSIIRTITPMIFEDLILLLLYQYVKTIISPIYLIAYLSFGFGIYHIHIYIRYNDSRMFMYFAINSAILIYLNLTLFGITNNIWIFLMIHSSISFTIQYLIFKNKNRD